MDPRQSALLIANYHETDRALLGNRLRLKGRAIFECCSDFVSSLDDAHFQ
jgi:hypothetical protein